MHCEKHSLDYDGRKKCIPCNINEMEHLDKNND